jgi:hypothetical protein
MICSNCGHDMGDDPWCAEGVPPEPPIGSWVKDRYGGISHRGENGSWGQPGMYYLASWVPMWNARGPLVPCGPWGNEES